MSLTGMRLIAVAALCAAGSLAATIVIWNRARVLRFLPRTVGILLTEALVVLAVGLVVNRSQQFYPTWAALLRTGNTRGTTYAVAPGRLDQWLLARAGSQRGQSLAFTWQPADWTRWHLTAAPLVVTPVDYLLHPDRRYSAVLSLDTGPTPWPAPVETAAARDADGAIVVFLDAGPATTVPDLTKDLPAALTSSLRVTTRRWAMVSSTSAAAIARQTVTADPTRYAALALVTAPTATVTHPAEPAKSPPAKSPPAKHPAIKHLPAKGATAKQPAAAVLAVEGRPVHLDGGADGIASALRWAAEQTPPPLAASTPAVTYVPLQRHHKRHRPRPYRSNPAPRPPADASPPVRGSAPEGGDHVSGQPRP